MSQIFDGFEWQQLQGYCPECSYQFLRFLADKTEKDFKYCLGFGVPDNGHYGMPYKPKPNKIVIGFECPECFTKSCCHVNKSWEDRYSQWMN